MPLPSSRRSTRRASASWCGSTRELSQLSPTDSEIENIRRSDSSFEAHDPALDSPGITLRPKGQLWLPIALIGTTAEENGNCIRKRYEYCIRQSENAKLSSDLLDSFDEKPLDECDINDMMPKVSKESDSSLNSNFSQNEYLVKKNVEKKDTYCIVTRNTKVKNEEINGRSRESSVESHKSDKDQSKSRVECKKRSLSVCGRVSPIVKRTRTMSTNSVHSVGRKKKLSPEEKLLQDNKEYFKMEVLNTKLRSTGSLLSVNINKDSEVNASNAKSIEKINKIIIKKIKIRRKRKRSKRTKARNKKSNESNFTTVIIENKKNVNVKINGVIRKKRQSELMKLCNEAESFMFGESSRQGCIATNATESESEEFSRKKKNSLPSIKANIIEEISTDSNCENEGKRRKKRRSHAEAFIHDNLDYYKFETPGSRLRYQGSFLDIKSEDKDFIYTLKHKKKEISKRNEVSGKLHLHVEVKEEKTEGQEKKRNSIIPSAEIEKILFSFESIPVTEPWYEVYKRQDEGLENYYPLLSNPNDQPFLLPYELPKPTYSKAPSVSEYYKRRRKKLVHLFNHPRKSPRCHASTLAILSSLKKRKRRSGTNISMNSLLSESPTNNLNASEEKFEVRQLERGKNELEDEEILDFLYNNQSDAEDNEIMLEPLSDCESKSTWKNSDSSRSVKSDEEETKNIKTGYRGKKLTKMDSTFEPDVSNEECKYFLWQTINPDDFFKDMVIETQKKSGLVVNIATILEHYKNCKSMEDSDDNLISKINMGCATEISEKNIKRKKKKARKINKTGWDNRKSRRRTGNRIDVKEVGCSEVKENRIKTTIKVREEGVNSSSIINSSKRRMKREVVNKNQEREDRPVLRSHLEISDNAVGLRHNSQDNETRSDVPNILDSSAQEYPSYVLRMKKLVDSGTNSNMRLRCSNGRYTLQKRRLILNRKKKRVVDYAWTTKKR